MGAPRGDKYRSALRTDDIAAHIKLGAAAKRYANISSLLTVPITQQDNVIGVSNIFFAFENSA